MARITYGKVEETLRKDLQTLTNEEKEELRSVLGKVGLTPAEIFSRFKANEIGPFLPWYLGVYEGEGAEAKRVLRVNEDCEAVMASAVIANSKKVYRSLDVVDSCDVRYSKRVYGSKNIESSNRIFESENCRESLSVEDSREVVCSENIKSSQYITFCFRLVNCRCCALCSDLTNGLFCFNFTPETKSNEKYYMFNTEVTREEFESALLCFERMKELYEAYTNSKIVSAVEFLEWYDSLPNSNRLFLKSIIVAKSISWNSVEDNKNFFNILFKKNEI